MFDMHYDLLTKIYMCYKKNDFSFIEKWIKNYNFENVRGLIANMCFMSIDEMKEEYDINYYDENVSIAEMFKISTQILKQYLPDDIIVLNSIEGCDFLQVDDLIELKKIGLNAIAPVWNNKNKFGSGNRSLDGLTPLGEELINKAIELNIGIDLSHANEKTFFDIIEIIKQKRIEGLNPVVYASHSNVRNLSNHLRNLTDEQIISLSEVDGIIGIISHSNFTFKGSTDKRIELNGTDEYYKYMELLKREYVKHIIYVHKLIGDTKNIAVSTDDMTFVETDSYYLESPIFKYSTIYNDLKKLLLEYYPELIVDDILYNNAISKLNPLISNELKTAKNLTK